jgi:hypothetical protein
MKPTTFSSPDDIKQLLEAGEHVVSDHWPEKCELAALPAFERHGAEDEAREIRRRLGSLKILKRLKDCPILGICGGLISGKSSVARIFLSSKGRQRVLVGMPDNAGTHRFVLWLPQTWLEEPEMRSAWDGLLGEVFGPQRDLLSEDVNEAHLQYNNVNLLETPLIAGDPKLETLKMGLLDCPDIMTDPPEKRLAMLAKASALCSALIVVLREDQVRSREMSSDVPSAIAKGAPSVPRYLLINKVEPDTNLVELLRDVRNHSSGDRGCYVASHFKINGWKEKTPSDLISDFGETEADKIPLPWRIEDRDEDNAPGEVQAERYFKNLPSQLNAGILFQTKTTEHWEILRKKVQLGFEKVAARLEKDGKDLRSAHEGLVELLEEQMTDDKGGAKNLFTVDYVLPLLASMERTAPGWLRPVIWMKKPFNPVQKLAENMSDKAGEGYESLAKKAPLLLRELMNQSKKPWHWLLRLLGRKEGDEAECKIEAPVLARRMKNARWCPQRFGEKELISAWEEVLHRTMTARVEIPDARKFDGITQEIWKVLPWHKQALFALKLVTQLAVLSGVVIAVVAEATLTFGGTGGTGSFIAAAALSKIIAGSLIGSVAGGAVSVLLNTFFRDTNTLPYLSAMLAYACDVFGLPRKIDPAKPIVVKWGVDHYDLPNYDEATLPVRCSLVGSGQLGLVNGPAKQRLIERLER